MGAQKNRLIETVLLTGFYTKLNVWGSLGLNFDYDGGPIIENGGPIFLYKSRILEGSTSFREGIWTSSHFHISTICIDLKLDRNFQYFFRAGFLDDSDLTDSEQPLEYGSWSISAFLLPKEFLRLLCSDILAAVYF